MTPEPNVTVVVVTFRAAAFLGATLDGLQAQTAPHLTLVVDNASTDGTAELLALRLPPDAVRRLPENSGFAGGVAAALPLITTRYVALLNDDAVPATNWLAELLAAADNDPAAAAWTSLMLLAARPDTINNFGVGLDERWYGVDLAAGESVTAVPREVIDVFGFCAGAVLLRTAAVRAVGGFPAEFFLYYEDLDTSWRLRNAGWSIRAVPTATVLHRHAATSDRRSALFHFYNERNRLLTLVRCAPLPVAPIQIVRFLMTTVSLLISRLIGRVLRRPVPDHANFRVGLRLRVLLDVARRMPAHYARRGSTRGRARPTHLDGG